MIDLSTATFIGPIATDDVILQTVPADYRDLLAVNGCILFGGGLHIRGACEHPEWHSLRQAWMGLNSLSNLYPNVQKTDIPLAQDAVGDQFLPRQDSVNRLNAETGDVNSLGMTWQVFLNAATIDPVQFLSLRPLIRFTSEGGRLDPGQLLSVHPPFCTSESSSGVSL